MKRNSVFVVTLVCMAGFSDVLMAQTKIQASSEIDVSVSDAKECPNCLAGVSYDLEIGANGTSGAPSFTFEIESMTEIKKVYAQGGFLAIYGELARGGDELVIVDLQSQSADVSIRGYDMQFSDSGRYVIYSEWYPRMRPGLSPGGVYLYDLSLTLSQNMADENFVYDDDMVLPYGRSIEPARDTSQVVTGMRLPGTTAWDQDELITGYIHETNGEYSLIAVDLSNGIDSIRKCEFPLFSALVSGQQDTEHFTPSLMEIIDGPSAVIDFYPNGVGSMRVEFDFTLERCATAEQR